MGRFFTPEDPYHVHKLLGLFTFLHYVYRFGEAMTMGACDFTTHRSVSLAAICGSMALSISSMQFRVPLRRIQTDRPMIWKMFRAHNILFALRSLFAVLVFELLPSAWHFACGACLIFCTMAFADTIERRLGTVEDKTMRAMPVPEGTTSKDYAQLQRLYSMAQFAATMSTVHSSTLALLAAMPVQLSAFLMTLVRKSRLSPLGWHVAYSFSLWLPFLALACMINNMHADITSYQRFIISAITSRVRRNTGWNKYVLWGFALATTRFTTGWEIVPNPLFRWAMNFLVLYDALGYRRILLALARAGTESHRSERCNPGPLIGGITEK